MQSINVCTMHNVNRAMDAAGMSDGHRQLFISFAERNTPMGFKGWMNILNALEKCKPIVSCLRDAGKLSKEDKKSSEEEVEDDKE